MFLFLVQALIILIVPLIVWWPLRKLIPLAVVQILAGIALGPTLFGTLAPELKAILFPSSSIAGLQVLSSLAVVCFCFTAGLHVDVEKVRNKGKGIVVVATSTFAFPMLVGLMLSDWAYDTLPSLRGDSANALSFKVALAVCFAVTALPVLSSILQEMGMLGSRIGTEALSIAAANDALIWPTVGIALILARGDSLWSVAMILLSFSIYLMLLLFVFQPILMKWVNSSSSGNTLDIRQKTILIGGLLASAACTEFMGLHAAIGAFLYGAIMPREVKQAMAAMVGPLTSVILLPFFLATTGLKVDVSAPEIGFLVASILIGGLTKFLSTAIPARLCGWSWSDSVQLGAFMQCKGIMEVLVLAVLLEAGTISIICFSTMTLMAIATTSLTMPLARLSQSPRKSVTKNLAINNIRGLDG
ncbi:cation:proton antiporter [Pseudomonas palleroniana]